MTALCTGYLVSNVFPARAGELARLVLLVSEQPVSVARTLSTIIVERLLDLLTLVVLLAVLLPFVQLPAEMARAAQVITVAALAGSVVMILFSLWKERLLGWAHLVLRTIRFLDRPQIYDAIGHLIDGFAALRGRLGSVADRAVAVGLGRRGRHGLVGRRRPPPARADYCDRFSPWSLRPSACCCRPRRGTWGCFMGWSCWLW